MSLPSVSPRRAFWWTLVATLLVQSAWILVVPIFRGIDEFDHAYRAAAVAHGQVIASQPAPRGRGNLVSVPLDLARAARQACSSRIYTEHDNCHPASRPRNGEARLASAAGNYNPAYYAVVGTLARPFHGEALGYAMRVTTSVLAALLFAWGAATTARWSRGGWPLLAFCVVGTPVLVYSTTIASPNGVHYCAGVLLWSALLAMIAAPDRPQKALPALTVGAVTLVCTHTTGLLWVALAFLVLSPLVPVRRWLAAARLQPRPWVVAGLVLGASALACLTWIVTQRTNAFGPPDPTIPSLTPLILVRGEMLWIMQSIAVFPMRDEPAPLLVYAVWCGALVLGAGLFLRHSSRRERLSMLILVILFLGVPGVLTMLSFSQDGITWQGRYTLPLTVGFGLLAARALAADRVSLHSAVVVATALGAALSAAVCVAKVHAVEAFQYDGTSLADRFPGGALIAVVVALSSALAWLAMFARREAAEPRPPLPLPHDHRHRVPQGRRLSDPAGG